MNPDDKSLRFKWWSTAKPSTTWEHTPFAEQLRALIELTHDDNMQPPCISIGTPDTERSMWALHLQTPRFSGEPTIPSVPWELGPIDELFLKTCGIKPE